MGEHWYWTAHIPCKCRSVASDRGQVRPMVTATVRVVARRTDMDGGELTEEGPRALLALQIGRQYLHRQRLAGAGLADNEERQLAHKFVLGARSQ